MASHAATVMTAMVPAAAAAVNRPRHAAAANSTTTIGASTIAEYFETAASAKKTTRPATLPAEGSRLMRQTKYSVPNMKQVNPISVVTSEECARMFGSKVKSVS